MMTSALVVAGCAVVIGLLGYLIWRGDQQINDATRRAFDEQCTAPTGASHVRILDDYRDHARREADKRRPCPTCSGPIRETVGMVCQTCGTDYGSAS